MFASVVMRQLSNEINQPIPVLLSCRCECPFGYTGPTCSTPMFPACKIDANSTEMHCGDHVPKSCDCLRQCRNHFCPQGQLCETPRDPWYKICFERQQQLVPAVTYSDIPEETDDHKVVWYRGIRKDMQRVVLGRPKAVQVLDMWLVDGCCTVELLSKATACCLVLRLSSALAIEILVSEAAHNAALCARSLGATKCYSA